MLFPSIWKPYGPCNAASPKDLWPGFRSSWRRGLPGGEFFIVIISAGIVVVFSVEKLLHRADAPLFPSLPPFRFVSKAIYQWQREKIACRSEGKPRGFVSFKVPPGIPRQFSLLWLGLRARGRFHRSLSSCYILLLLPPSPSPSPPPPFAAI